MFAIADPREDFSDTQPPTAVFVVAGIAVTWSDVLGAWGLACAPSHYLFFLPWTVESILDTMLTGRSTSNPASSSIPESSSAQLFALLRIPGRSIAVCKASHSRKYCSLCTWTNFPDFLLGLFFPFPSVSPRGREGGIFSIYPQIPFVRCMQPLHSYFS